MREPMDPMNKLIPNTRRNIYISDDQWEKLRLLAYKNRWSVSKLIRHIIENYIEVILNKKGGDTR